MSDPKQYTVGWICAIPTESIAASSFLDEEHERPDHLSSNDSNDYTLGKMAGHNVVIAVLPDGQYGQSSATGVVKDMLNSFPNIRVGLMVGIAGGAPTAQNDIRLGDVVVSSPQNGTGGVYQYDYGKLIQGQKFQQTGFLNQPSPLVRTTVSGLKTQYKRKGHKIDETIKAVLNEYPRLADDFSRPREDRDRLYKADFVHPVGHKGDCDDSCGVLPERLVERRARTQKEDNPAIHYGIIASGNWLLKDAIVRDAFADEKGIMCFEMEAAGLMNHLPCLVIRGICDYSDSHKNKEWQGYAAMTAAAYAKDLLARMVPSRVEAEQKVAETLKSIEDNTLTIIETTYETAANVNELKADARYQRIYSWLSPPDHTANQNEALSKRHEGTGQWFVRSEVFAAFREGKVPFLWLSGIPGCGKTVLSSSIIENLQQTSSVSSAALLYFYFDFSDVRKQTLDDALRSLLWQLTKHSEGSFREVEQLYKSCKDGENQPSTQSLIRALESILQGIGRVMTVLDALDECETRRELLQWLAETAAKNSSGIQMITTSRKEYDIEFAFTKWLTNDVMLSVQQLEVDKDIQAYIHARIRSDPGLERWKDKPFVQNEIELKLMKKAQGIPDKPWWRDPKPPSPLPQPLYYASLGGLEFVASRLLESGADINSEGDRYDNALQAAAARGLEDIVNLLLQKGADVNAYRGQASTLQVASVFGHVRVVQSLLAHGANVNAKGTSALRDACARGHLKVVKLLLDSGADVNNQDGGSGSALQAACEIGCDRIVQLLLEHGADINAPAVPNCDEAFGAAFETTGDCDFHHNRENVVLLLLEKCNGLSVADQRFSNLLHNAANAGFEKVVNRLLTTDVEIVAREDRRTDFNGLGGVYDRALGAASHNSHGNIVQMLLDRGADANVKVVLWRGAEADQYGSALQAASEAGHAKIVQMLLQNTISADGGTVNAAAFDIAFQWGYTDVLETLLKRPCRETIADQHGWSPEAHLVVCIGLTPQNHASDSELTGRIQACADHPIPAGLNDFFFEVEIVCGGHDSLIAIGLGNGSSLGTGMPGWKAGSWAYHGDDGKKFDETSGGRGESYNETYGTGDTICCGIDFNSNTVDFYKNGTPLGTEAILRRVPIIPYGDVTSSIIGDRARRVSHRSRDYGVDDAQEPVVWIVEPALHKAIHIVPSSIRTLLHYDLKDRHLLALAALPASTTDSFRYAPC
ncbi:purine and uridine phosphorylase, partial [Aureobasidium melanogenum]